MNPYRYTGPIPTERDFDQIADFIAAIAKKVGVVTIATSPGYAIQEVAIRAAKRLAKEIIR